MRCKALVFALVVAVLAVAPASAQFIGRTVTVAQLGACQNARAMAYVTDATNATTLGAGGGEASVFVNCASGSWAIDSVEDVSSLTGYIQASEAAQVSIEATGAGNDLTLAAADDVIVSPTDALTAVAGGAVTLTGTVGTVAIAASAGAVTVTAVGAGNDITATAADDFIVAAADIAAGATATIAFDAAGGTDELGIAENAVSIGASIAFRIVGGSAPPVACAAGTKGTLYFDTDINKFCACNGTNYVLMNDDSTTTGCS